MHRLRYSRNPTWKISHLQLLPVMGASDCGLRQLPGAASDCGQLPEVGPDNKANQPNMNNHEHSSYWPEKPPDTISDLLNSKNFDLRPP